MERNEEAEGPFATGVRGADHPEDWKYSRVGTESAVAPSAPSRRRAAHEAGRGGSVRHAGHWHTRGVLARSVGYSKEEHVGVGDDRWATVGVEQKAEL